MDRKNKIVGILGGMGPFATAMFFQNILELTPTKKDWDHLRVIIDSNPHIPSRSRAILYNEETPVARMIDSCKQLSSYPVDFIVVPCNSACYFLPEVQRKIKVPILNIIDIASEEMYLRTSGSRRIAVLGGMVTYLKKTYKKSLEKRGCQLIEHDKKTQDKVVELIERIKKGEGKETLKSIYSNIADQVKECNAEGLILACTELSLLKNIDIGLPVVDSSHALAEYTVLIALGKKAIPLDNETIHEFWKKRSHMLVEGKVSDYQSTLLTTNKKLAEERDYIEKEKLLRYLKKYSNYLGERAIEYGCGVGRLTEMLSKYFSAVDAMDYCSDFIEVAKKNAKKKNIDNINYFISSIENFKSHRKYDFALSAGLMIFLDERQFCQLVKTIAENLRPGGICLVRESVGFSDRFELHNYYSEAIDSNYNAVYRSSDEIIDKFTEYGFALKEEEITLPPKPDKPETCQKIIILEKK